MSIHEKLEVVYFPHPTLRHNSKPIQRVDAELRKAVAKMFELMFAHNGIGLAANQVDLPLQLFVINLECDASRAESHVFINPVISQPKGSDVREEGCLSIPQVFGNVARPESVRVRAYNLQGELFDERVDGLFARAVQHEHDHLHGVLFPDRMSDTELKSIEAELDDFRVEFQSRQRTGSTPRDDQIQKRLTEIEARYC